MSDTRGALEELFKVGVWDSLVAAGLSSLFIAMPWTAVWPLGPVIRLIVKTFSDKLYEGLKMLVELEEIVLKDTATKKTFDTEAVRLKIIAQDRGINSPEFQKAKEEAKIALSQMVRTRLPA